MMVASAASAAFIEASLLVIQWCSFGFEGSSSVSLTRFDEQCWSSSMSKKKICIEITIESRPTSCFLTPCVNQIPVRKSISGSCSKLFLEFDQFARELNQITINQCFFME
jgi:hypothetical protein